MRNALFLPTPADLQRAAGDFITVASWHRACYDLTHPVPAQRTGDHDADARRSA